MWDIVGMNPGFPASQFPNPGLVSPTMASAFEKTGNKSLTPVVMVYQA